MNNVKMLAVVLGALPVMAAHAEETDRFGSWRLAVGGAFNGAARGSMHARNLQSLGSSAFRPYTTSTRDAAYAKAKSGEYDGGGYVRKDDQTGVDGWPMTENWRLPADALQSDGNFHMYNAYHEESLVAGSGSRAAVGDKFNEDASFGISAELSREIWSHDAAFENRWGVDFAAAFSYFFQRDFYSSHGSVSRNDKILTRDGKYETTVDPGDALYDYLEETNPTYRKYPSGGMYGFGNDVSTGFAPALNVNGISEPVDLGGTESYRASRSGVGAYSAEGDYRELEMLFTFRPWYEITDWWRVYGHIGVGVSWGRFESSFWSSSGVGLDESFDQWDCYGVAGLGTMFRYGMFDLSLDFLGRFLRDDMEIDGRYVNGEIRRSNWGFRVMVGVEF